MKKETGGPAFPYTKELYSGMTLRDYFAAKAMQGLLASPNVNQEWLNKHLVVSAYLTADEMLKARKQ